MSVCKTCGAAITWVKLPTGRTMPLDAGSFTAFLIDGDKLNALNPSARPVQVRQSHFATCPQAAQHRRPKGPPEAA